MLSLTSNVDFIIYISPLNLKKVRNIDVGENDVLRPKEFSDDEPKTYETGGKIFNNLIFVSLINYLKLI